MKTPRNSNTLKNTKIKPGRDCVSRDDALYRWSYTQENLPFFGDISSVPWICGANQSKFYRTRRKLFNE